MTTRDQETFELSEALLDDYQERMQNAVDLYEFKVVMIEFINEFRKPEPRRPIRRIGQTDAS